MRVYKSNGISTTLAGRAGGLGAKTGLYTINTKPRGELRFSKEASSFGASDYKEPKRVDGSTTDRRTMVVAETSHGGKFVNKRGLSPTLHCRRTNNVPHIAPTVRAEHHNTADVHYIPKQRGIRRLTPLECERLQSFPDNWTKYGILDNGIEHISNTQRYKMLGNAVTVNVIEAITNKLSRVAQITA